MSDPIEALIDQLDPQLAAAWQRIGYLEEALRHIRELADRGGYRYIERVINISLSTGDPLTCPEARPAAPHQET